MGVLWLSFHYYGADGELISCLVLIYRAFKFRESCLNVPCQITERKQSAESEIRSVTGDRLAGDTRDDRVCFARNFSGSRCCPAAKDVWRTFIRHSAFTCHTLKVVVGT